MPASTTNIATKELIPIVLAAAAWGHLWQGALVQAFCDNIAVVNVINKAAAADPNLMHLLRCLHFFMAHYCFAINAVHLPGSQNTAADALSRNDRKHFFSLIAQAAPEPTLVSTQLIRLLIIDRPNWTSQLWRNLFSASTLRD